MHHLTCDGLARRQVREAGQRYAVAFEDLVVVRRLAERQREQSLLLQVRLVNPREAARDDRGPAEETRDQRGVLAARAFTVVRVADDYPGQTLRLVLAGHHRDLLVALT